MSLTINFTSLYKESPCICVLDNLLPIFFFYFNRRTHIIITNISYIFSINEVLNKLKSLLDKELIIENALTYLVIGSV